MLELLIVALILYVTLKLAWWVLKTTLFLGIAAVILGILILPWAVFV